MKKSRIIISLYSSIILILVTTISICFSMSFALYNKYVNGNGTYGEISLRSYYECGSGTEDDPYVITRPRHLYNFSRLQGLGIYGEKKHFQLGKVDLGGVDSGGVPMCYADDYSSTQKPYLDMSNSDRDTNPINAIGSEALPFYGAFDGQYVEIKNLNVYANPEDAGLFGYTAHGSAIENIFLSNITIHALGYTDGYDDLYSPESDIGDYTYFIYDPNTGEATTDFTKNYDQTIYTYYYANNMTDFEYREEGSSLVPSVSIESSDDSPYTFTSLLSGDLITFDSSNNIVPNIERVFSFFKEKKNEEDIEYPIRATSTASLVVSSVDSFGQKHSKVILTVEYNFTLDEGKDFISMGVHVGNDHGNNIGLVAGHCDGTVHDCYVYNGSFKMNDGGAGYNNLANGSDLGLIGKVGGTVQNILATESDIAVKEGKSIGVLDFTTVYREIIDSNSFVGTHTPSGLNAGTTYEPISTSKYIQYLRKYNGEWVTNEEGKVSFRGRKIVTNDDLGVFTVATDAKTTGMDNNVLDNHNSVIATEDLTIDDASGEDNYYIYYSTAEYVNGYADGFDKYVASYNDRTKTTLLPGYHFPSKDQVTRESFALREARQNYFIRFKLDPSYRRGKGFYFSDVDTNTDGGAFLANYFNYKLVDQNGSHIPAGSNKCGVMLKTNLREEVSSLSASFACPTVYKTGTVLNGIFCLEDQTLEKNKYVSNMVNFEIVNEEANVTIIAAPSDKNKPSVLGVYKLKDDDFSGSIDYTLDNYDMRFTRPYNNPDYAFFMPTDSNLSYFDYRVNSITHKGEVGVYDSNGVFTSATNGTDATVPAEYNYSEFGYETGKTRLFAHTFLLPKGRYCIGSADLCGEGDTACAPKIYYICAQGQDDGQFDFEDTVFTSNDRVEDVDFVNVPRFNEDGTANIVIADVSAYNPTSPTEGNKLGNRRLYVALVNSDRSLFSDMTSDISFTYDPGSGKFIINSTLTGSDLIEAMTHVAVDNYKPTLINGDQKDLTVVLFNIESNGDVIAYPLYT